MGILGVPDTMRQMFNFSGKKISVAQVTFGTPSKNCTGVGICKVDLIETFPANYSPGQCAKTLALITLENEYLTCLFFQRLICHNTKRRLFAGSHFTIPEDVPLSLTLPSTGDYLVKHLLAGHYPLFERGDMWQIEIAVALENKFSEFNGFYNVLTN